MLSLSNNEKSWIDFYVSILNSSQFCVCRDRPLFFEGGGGEKLPLKQSDPAKTVEKIPCKESPKGKTLSKCFLISLNVGF